MKDALQVFNYAGRTVRVIELAGQPYFVGKDVAEVLGYKDTVFEDGLVFMLTSGEEVKIAPC